MVSKEQSSRPGGPPRPSPTAGARVIGGSEWPPWPPALALAASLAVALWLCAAPTAGASRGGTTASACPKQAKAALALSANATKKAAQAALAAAPERYRGLNVKDAKVVWSKLATKAGPRGGEVAHQCGRAIQAKTVVVELQFPKELPSSSLSEAVVFVSRFNSGYQVWELAH